MKKKKVNVKPGVPNSTCRIITRKYSECPPIFEVEKQDPTGWVFQFSTMDLDFLTILTKTLHLKIDKSEALSLQEN